MDYDKKCYLVGVIAVKKYFKNKKSVVYYERKYLSLEGKKDKYSLKRLKCQKIAKIFSIMI